MEYTENPSMVCLRMMPNTQQEILRRCFPFQVKAQIVSALKAMTHNLNYGDKVSHLLNSNSIWADFRDQKHDLFITDSNIRGYLTGKPQHDPYTIIMIFNANYLMSRCRCSTNCRLFDSRSKQNQ